MRRIRGGAWSLGLLSAICGFGLSASSRDHVTSPRGWSPSAARGDETVLEQLARSQQSLGISLVSIRNNSVYVVNFAEHSEVVERQLLTGGTVSFGEMSRDATEIAVNFCAAPGLMQATRNDTECPSGSMHLAILNQNGDSIHDFPDLTYPSGMCWSGDGSKIAASISDRATGDSESTLSIVDLSTGVIQRIDSPDAHVTSQCWSPDDGQIVYTLNKPRGSQTVRLYDAQSHTARDLAHGTFATWSADGASIAYLSCPPTLRDCTYNSISPSGMDKRVLWKVSVPGTALLWSPDSRIVTYLGPPRLSKTVSASVYPEVAPLIVRRLEDASEEQVTTVPNGATFQWVSGLKLRPNKQ
jgi:hypothetical protein